MVDLCMVSLTGALLPSIEFVNRNCVNKLFNH
jgi:hypothetical protein